jgi:hypothetical protein
MDWLGHLAVSAMNPILGGFRMAGWGGNFSMPSFNTGGPVYRAGGGSIFKPRGTDTVPAMLTPGEFVIRKSSVDKIGVGNLQSLNSGGGAVPRSSGGIINGFSGGGPVQYRNGGGIIEGLRQLSEGLNAAAAGDWGGTNIGSFRPQAASGMGGAAPTRLTGNLAGSSSLWKRVTGQIVNSRDWQAAISRANLPENLLPRVEDLLRIQDFSNVKVKTARNLLGKLNVKNQSVVGDLIAGRPRSRALNVNNLFNPDHWDAALRTTQEAIPSHGAVAGAGDATDVARYWLSRAWDDATDWLPNNWTSMESHGAVWSRDTGSSCHVFKELPNGKRSKEFND